MERERKNTIELLKLSFPELYESEVDESQVDALVALFESYDETLSVVGNKIFAREFVARMLVKEGIKLIGKK